MIRDVTIQRWATWSEDLSKQRNLRPYILTSLRDPDPRRKSTGPATEAFHRIGLDRQCILSAEPITRLDVDHLIPWSLFPRHDYTNLVPSERVVNQHVKKDRIPVLTDGLEERLRGHLDALQAAGDPWLATQPRYGGTNAVLDGIQATLEDLASITGRPRYVPA